MVSRSMVCLLWTALAASAFDHDYALYDEFLQRHVCKGGVEYAKLVKDESAVAIARQFESVTKPQYDAMDKNHKIAYLINTYNFYTLTLIKAHYPLKTGIRDIAKPWDTEFVPLFGKKVSLNHIEHEILRKHFREPRIHFAVNCASIGCPKLASEAYTGAELDAQLDAAAREFLTDTSKNRVEGKKLRLSKIFQWYGGDFKKTHGGYREYVKKVLGLEGKFPVSFLDYDWSLNEVTGCK
jgi:hypothetical protein